MVDFTIRPDATDSAGGWLTQASGSDLHTAIDETSPDDGDYIRSVDYSTNDICKIRLSNPSGTVNVVDNLVLRLKRSDTLPVINVLVRLLEGTTVRADWELNNISESLVTENLAITSGESAAITDFNNLYLQIIANPAIPFLDSISNLGPVYSLRKCLSGYSGSCIRIRRSSDNSEQDIGFVENKVDVASIASFIGGGDGFIVTWYDQNGNTVDVTQATAGNQPQFILSGMNGRPSIRFTSSSNHYLSKASVGASSLANSNECTFFVAQKQDAADLTNATFAWGSNPRYDALLQADNFLSFDFGGDGSASGRVSGAIPGSWNGVAHVVTGFRTTGNSQQLHVDGASFATDTESLTLSGTNTFFVGAFGSATYNFTGDICEIILVKDDTGSTNRGTIEDSMAAYYGIVVA